MDLVLASASPARLTTLRHCGLSPRVIVAQVDEEALLEELRRNQNAPSAQTQVITLARAKAREIARNENADIIIGCDSMLELSGKVVGKPHTPKVAKERWLAMSGASAVLHTGHTIIVNKAGKTREISAPSATTVHFANLSEAEIDAYIATGEPLKVAGAFTVDGLGGAYVRAIEGDYHAVVGISLPLLRQMLLEAGILWHELWEK